MRFQYILGITCMIAAIGVMILLAGIFIPTLGFSMGFVISMIFFLAAGDFFLAKAVNKGLAIIAGIASIGIFILLMGIFNPNVEFTMMLLIAIGFFAIAGISVFFVLDLTEPIKSDSEIMKFQRQVTTKQHERSAPPKKNRKEQLTKIFNRYTEIELDELAKLLDFTNTLELQQFLLDLPEDAPIKVEGKIVKISTGSNGSMINQAIDELSKRFDEWENLEYTKTGKST